MANALDVAKNALRRYHAYHGYSKDVYGWCQALAYWCLVAARGSENGLRTYPTARAANIASSKFTRNVNDASIQPGDMLFWDWPNDDHVGMAVGRQNGRVLVAHTGVRGSDTVLDLGSSWKISHADSINLTFDGASRTNGTNPSITGLTAWPTETLQPHERRVTPGDPANGREQPTRSSAIVQKIDGNDTGEFDGWIRGESVDGNNIWFRGKFEKRWYWSGSFTDKTTKGLADLNPPADPTIRTTNGVVRVRTDPSTNNASPSYYDVGKQIKIEGWITGQPVEGIDVWFKTADGWAWSDGFTNRSTTGLKNLNETKPDPEPTPVVPKPEFPPLITPTALDFPAWIAYDEVIDPDTADPENTEEKNALYYKKYYDPIESHTHWWNEPDKGGTHDANVEYLRGHKDLSANYVVSENRITLMVHLDRLAYTTGARNPYGWKTENDPTLTEQQYKTMGFLHYLVETMNPRLRNEAIRLHKEFTATSCSLIQTDKVRMYAEKFFNGELNPATGEPYEEPGEDLEELIQKLMVMLETTDNNLVSVNSNLISVFKSAK